MALYDICEYVGQEAAWALAKINTDEALKVLKNVFFFRSIERPNHIAGAISKFGTRGFRVLIEGTKSSSPNIRYYSARGLSLTGLEEARSILEEMADDDHEKTTFGGLVSTAAKKGLKTLTRIQNAKNE
jgi:hypothetical protein